MKKIPASRRNAPLRSAQQDDHRGAEQHGEGGGKDTQRRSHAVPCRQRAGQDAGEDNAEQTGTFAPSRHPGAYIKLIGEPRAPGQVGDVDQAVQGVGEGQRCPQPDCEGEAVEGRGRQQRRHRQAQKEGGARQQTRPAARRATVYQPAEPGVLHGVQQARQEQHAAGQGQTEAEVGSIEVRHQHIDRQHGHCQRQAKHAVGGKGGLLHRSPSRLRRKPGSRLRGSNQMAKKASANCGSVTSWCSRSLT